MSNIIITSIYLKVKAQTGSMMMMPETPEIMDTSEVRSIQNIRKKRSNNKKHFLEVAFDRVLSENSKIKNIKKL